MVSEMEEYAIFLGCSLDVMHGLGIASPTQYQEGYCLLFSD